MRLSFISISSFNVLPIFPMLAGMHPPRSLLANTRTETGELPKLSGMPKRNLLSLRNKASKSLSKIFEGTGPSKSLNLRSKNFNEGNERTTFGNPPTNLLLLKSSSLRSFKWLKVFGTTPQKRFELRWKRTRSVRRPSSGTNEPAMSAWLRSIPATTLIEGSVKDGAQNTPP